MVFYGSGSIFYKSKQIVQKYKMLNFEQVWRPIKKIIKKKALYKWYLSPTTQTSPKNNLRDIKHGLLRNQSVL